LADYSDYDYRIVEVDFSRYDSSLSIDLLEVEYAAYSHADCPFEVMKLLLSQKMTKGEWQDRKARTRLKY